MISAARRLVASLGAVSAASPSVPILCCHCVCSAHQRRLFFFFSPPPPLPHACSAEPPQDNGSGARGSIGRGSRSAVRVGSDFKSGEGGEGGGGGGSPALSDDFRRGSGSGTHLDRGRDDGRNYEDEKSPTWAENETGAGVQPARNGRGEPTAAGGRVSELAARSSSGSGSPRSYDGSDMLEAAATGSSSGANSPRPGGYISPSVRSPSWKSRGGPPVEDVDFL